MQLDNKSLNEEFDALFSEFISLSHCKELPIDWSDEPEYELTAGEMENQSEATCPLPEAELADAHDCRESASEYGICAVCGAIIPGSRADYDLHGYDPIGTD